VLDRSTMAVVNNTFDKIDNNGDGQLDANDFDHQDPDERAQWAGLAAAADANGDGVVTRAEFIEGAVRYALLEDDDLAELVAKVRDKVNEAITRAASHFEEVVGNGGDMSETEMGAAADGGEGEDADEGANGGEDEEEGTGTRMK